MREMMLIGVLAIVGLGFGFAAAIIYWPRRWRAPEQSVSTQWRDELTREGKGWR